jgi:hypothetical protein
MTPAHSEPAAILPPKEQRLDAHREGANELSKVTFPFKSSGSTVLSLGRIITTGPNASKYHNTKFIWPVGYQTVRSYGSTVDPFEKVEYLCEIAEGEDGPMFRVTCRTNGDSFAASTPTAAWGQVVRAWNEVRFVNELFYKHECLIRSFSFNCKGKEASWTSI